MWFQLLQKMKLQQTAAFVCICIKCSHYRARQDICISDKFQTTIFSANTSGTKQKRGVHTAACELCVRLCATEGNSSY